MPCGGCTYLLFCLSAHPYGFLSFIIITIIIIFCGIWEFPKLWNFVCLFGKFLFLVNFGTLQTMHGGGGGWGWGVMLISGLAVMAEVVAFKKKN